MTLGSNFRSSYQDPKIQKMSSDFTNDFDSSFGGAGRGSQVNVGENYQYNENYSESKCYNFKIIFSPF
jgi:hypothetical protein